jgi:hypothetical protein
LGERVEILLIGHEAARRRGAAVGEVANFFMDVIELGFQAFKPGFHAKNAEGHDEEDQGVEQDRKCQQQKSPGGQPVR